MRVAPLGLVAGFAVVAAAAALDAQQVFRAGVDTVYLPVVVTARNGTPVRGLSANDFEIRENGRLQAVVTLSEGSGVLPDIPGGGDVPLHLGILLDRSGSMDDDFKAASGAAVKFINALDAARDVTLVEFETRIRLARFEPTNYPQLFSRIRESSSGLQTAFYDAVVTYIDAARKRGGQHLLVIYSDGQDSSSEASFGELLRLLRLGNVIVYAIGYLEHQPASNRFQARQTLTSIAHETGGEAYFPVSERELDGIYSRILGEVASRYTVGYVSNDASRDGRFRRVEVKIRPPRNQGVRIRTRSGYIAMPEEGP